MTRKWPSVVLAIAYVLTGLLHLIPAVMDFFVYGAKGSLSSQPELLPIYGRLGTFGFAIFFATIPLDFVAAVYLLRSRNRGRAVVAIAALLNLPLIPLGTLVGACTLGLLFIFSRDSRRSPQSL
jgi:hypothetical protein